MAKGYLQRKKEFEERYFSDFATKSFPRKARKYPLIGNKHRTDFERDSHRILHFPAFRRLRHKTQVFFAPKNDHLCTRMEHALHVASISKTICNILRLNADLANAIALAHDLGHPPFGHRGEYKLTDLCRKGGLPSFKHEAQSFRVVNRFIENNRRLNLTYEVMDGIVCHYGEGFEQELRPDRNKNLNEVNATAARKQCPATLEGCVVRIADRVAYLGRDMEDAIEVGIISRKDVPESVRNGLGRDNGEIIGTLIDDIARESEGVDAIKTSKQVVRCVKDLSDFNYKKIYKSNQLTSQFTYIDRMIEDLFNEFIEVTSKTERGRKNTKNYTEFPYQVFFDFIKSMKYTEDETEGQIVVDYIAHMTDNFALQSFQKIRLFSPPY